MSAGAITFDASLPPAARPLALLARERLEAELRAALRAGDGAAGAHCIHELWVRGEFAANIESALAALWRSAADSIPEWLPMRYFTAPRIHPCALVLTHSGTEGDISRLKQRIRSVHQ